MTTLTESLLDLDPNEPDLHEHIERMIERARRRGGILHLEVRLLDCAQ